MCGRAKEKQSFPSLKRGELKAIRRVPSWRRVTGMLLGREEAEAGAEEAKVGRPCTAWGEIWLCILLVDPARRDLHGSHGFCSLGVRLSTQQWLMALLFSGVRLSMQQWLTALLQSSRLFFFFWNV